MPFVIPPLESIKPASWVKPTLGSRIKSAAPLAIPLIACVYVAVVILLPAVSVVVQAFAKGVGPFLENFESEDLRSALRLTLITACIAVPANTVFGLAAATAIARKKFKGKALLLSVIDLPFSISPVVVGLMLVLLYSPSHGVLAGVVNSLGWKILFSTPGIVLATIIVTFPFMAREVIPLLEEEGWEQEEAAKTLGATNWQVFWKVTLPSVRWAALYGLILTTARALGEFGAVSVVSGNIASQTQTLPLFV
ncbi:MAG: sulfate ABC transporter permease subunit, partial [Synechococcaceae bacterium WBB_32_011]|nr:sulfate ABC transporter permease subunit [Synechococcaceae bacterium WBB_32_011]